MMFPYPSAEGLHVGNMYAFTGADVYGRLQRMLGNDVFEPIGLDGFGIHSENYAMKVGRTPQEHAKISQKNFYRQMHSIGNGFAWDNKLETYDPAYYKWTQWIFIQLFKAGLAYRKKAAVNFCPSCKTVLADEQVIDGKCERCGTGVEKKELEQWFFRITQYADRLLKNLEDLIWTEKVKIAQKNWIGKKVGINITYEIIDHEEKITVFTTRPDTNFGATFIALAPENPLVLKISREDHKQKVLDYIKETSLKTEQDRISEGKEKTGVFTGAYALNPLSSYKMPIWVSDFVLAGFGTGALVGVPGHDKRDFEFAKKFDLKIKRVVVGADKDTSPIRNIEQVQEEEGTMINSDFLNGLNIHVATEKIMDFLEEKEMGKRVSTYHLRDWLISRQRYWGPPIPMVFCENCAEKGISWFTNSDLKEKKVSSIKHKVLSEEEKILDTKYLIPNTNEMYGWFPVEDKDLPVFLPELENWKPIGVGASPLALAKDWVAVKCPQCHKMARRETDVSDTFLDSAWYFLRYPNLGNQYPKSTSFKEAANSKSKIKSNELEIRNLKLEIPWDQGITMRWLPVTMYIGGAEHSVLHLLYARFITMVFKDLGLVDFEEPFSRFYAHGLIIKDGAKMSKSKGNVVVPDQYIAKYGADAMRTYLMFLGPFHQGGNFSDTAMEGMYKFLKRVWMLAQRVLEGRENREKKKMSSEHLKMLHKTIRKVTEEIQHLRYNTAIAALMEYYNFLSGQEQVSMEEIEVYIKLLAPFAPHMTEEIWHEMQFTVHGSQLIVTEKQATAKPETDNGELRTDNQSIHTQPWPVFKDKYLMEDEAVIVIQINGKVRDSIRIKKQEAEIKETVEQKSLLNEKVKKYLDGKKIIKTIYVPGKVLNFVVI